MRNYKDTVVDRTQDFVACSAVPQPTAPSRAPIYTARSTLNTEETPSLTVHFKLTVILFFHLFSSQKFVVFAYFDKHV